MKVFNLRCAAGHDFEGWFANDEAYASQTERALVECPVCGEHRVDRLPSAPRLNLSGASEPAATPPATSVPTQRDLARDIETLWLKTLRQVIAHTEDVGRQFADEARKIHQGEAEPRPIRGQATPDEVKALREDDIEVLSLPVPPHLKETLQ